VLLERWGILHTRLAGAIFLFWGEERGEGHNRPGGVLLAVGAFLLAEPLFLSFLQQHHGSGGETSSRSLEAIRVFFFGAGSKLTSLLSLLFRKKQMSSLCHSHFRRLFCFSWFSFLSVFLCCCVLLSCVSVRWSILPF